MNKLFPCNVPSCWLFLRTVITTPDIPPDWNLFIELCVWYHDHWVLLLLLLLLLCSFVGSFADTQNHYTQQDVYHSSFCTFSPGLKHNYGDHCVQTFLIFLLSQMSGFSCDVSWFWGRGIVTAFWFIVPEMFLCKYKWDIKNKISSSVIEFDAYCVLVNTV